ATGDRKYFDYLKETVDRLIDADGVIRGYKVEDYNLDNLNMGKVLFSLLAEASDAHDRERYRRALQTLRGQLVSQPRVADGGFWHKQIYPHQMWLDGAYMADPFLAQYGAVFDDPKAIDDAVEHILLLERHTRDPKTGLLYHAWDESKAERWARPDTGTSRMFWARSIGWYMMAMVDTLERLPEQHRLRRPVREAFERTAAAIASVQDPATGVWWQVLDAPRKDKNYREASASSMFVYA